MRKINTKINDEINFLDLFRLILKEKILLISITTFCLILSLILYSYLKNNKGNELHQINIKIEEPDINALLTFQNSVVYQYVDIYKNKLQLRQKYIDTFHTNFSSVNLLSNFIDARKESENFKKFLREKNVEISTYFNEKRFLNVLVGYTKIQNEYILLFHYSLDGKNLIKDYIQFIKEKTINDLKVFLISYLELNKKLYQEDLKMAEELGIEKPYLAFTANEVRKNTFDKIFLGSKYLQNRIEYIDNLIFKVNNDINKDIINLNFFISNAEPYKFYKGLEYLPLLALIFGFFLSLMIILIKNVFIKISK